MGVPITPLPERIPAPAAPPAPSVPSVPSVPAVTAPAPVPAAPAVTEDGLAMRRPGASMSANLQAASAEAGRFRRLPTPGDDGDTDAVSDTATRRQRMLSALSGGVDRGRTDPDQEDPA
jgi:hypothetical protein